MKKCLLILCATIFNNQIIQASSAQPTSPSSTTALQRTEDNNKFLAENGWVVIDEAVHTNHSATSIRTSPTAANPSSAIPSPTANQAAAAIRSTVVELDLQQSNNPETPTPAAASMTTDHAIACHWSFLLRPSQALAAATLVAGGAVVAYYALSNISSFKTLGK